ncbi:MAG: BlaI/MecI/CopY family transcriptional regulator [Bacteroidota bacterium]
MANTPPTASELAVLNLLWDRGPLTVRAVYDELVKEKDVVYTTILKTMQVMYERGYVSRERVGRQHVYAAIIAREPTQDKLLDGFLGKTFGGSAQRLVMRALGNYKTSKDELRELKALIERLENEEQ